jgi:hypothetical protein
MLRPKQWVALSFTLAVVVSERNEALAHALAASVRFGVRRVLTGRRAQLLFNIIPAPVPQLPGGSKEVAEAFLREGAGLTEDEVDELRAALYGEK